MKTSIIYKTYYMVVVLILMMWGFGSSGFAASTSKPVSKSPEMKRMDANVHFDKGKILQDQGRFKEAADAYKKAVRIDASYAEAWSNLGFAYRKQGQFKKAVRTYKKAIKLSPNLSEAHEYLGEAYAEMGKWDLAQQELEILKKLDPDEAGELEVFIAKMKSK